MTDFWTDTRKTNSTRRLTELQRSLIVLFYATGTYVISTPALCDTLVRCSPWRGSPWVCGWGGLAHRHGFESRLPCAHTSHALHKTSLLPQAHVALLGHSARSALLRNAPATASAASAPRAGHCPCRRRLPCRPTQPLLRRSQPSPRAPQLLVVWRLDLDRGRRGRAVPLMRGHGGISPPARPDPLRSPLHSVADQLLLSVADQLQLLLLCAVLACAADAPRTMHGRLG